MKRFKIENCTVEEFKNRQKCWKTKQDLWDLVNKYFDENHNDKTFEENMLIISINRMINNIDIDKVIAEAYGEELDD